MCCENECDDIVLLRGIPGNGVDSTVDNDNGTFTITYTDGSTFTSADLRGADGNGILSTVDNGDGTFTFNYTNGSSFTTSNLTGPAGSFSGTVNYVSKFTGTGDTLGDSQIRDNGSNVGINRAPLPNYRVRVDTSTDLFALTGANTSTTGGGHGVFGLSSGVTASTNFGVLGDALGSSVQNVGVRGQAAVGSAGKNVGLVGRAASGASNYAVQLIDGTEGIGKVLTCMTAGGDGNWATPASGGKTWFTVTGPNPFAALIPNSGYVIRDTIGGGTTNLTMPSSGVVVGDEIKIIATSKGIAGLPVLQRWALLQGRASDVIYYDLWDSYGANHESGVKSTATLWLFNDVIDSITSNQKACVVILTCVEDLINGYSWNIEFPNNARL